MKRILLLAALAATLCVAAPAAATPTVTFTTTSLGDQTFTFDATSTVCRYGPCAYNWRYFGATTSHLGATLGAGVKVTFRFPVPGVYSVVLTVSERCSATSRTWCPGRASTTVSA